MSWKKKYGRDYYANNKDEVLKRNRERYAANPDHDRDKHLRRKYGITLVQYRQMEADQGGVCKLCGDPPSVHHRQKLPGGGNLQVDHDHKTNRVRGLLCGDCNRALGLFKDAPALLMKAVGYLNGDQHP